MPKPLLTNSLIANSPTWLNHSLSCSCKNELPLTFLYSMVLFIPPSYTIPYRGHQKCLVITYPIEM